VETVHNNFGAEQEAVPQDQFQFVEVSVGELEFRVPTVQAFVPVGLEDKEVALLLGPQTPHDAVALQVRDKGNPEQTPLPPVHVWV
jgi:hypothetical protein